MFPRNSGADLNDFPALGSSLSTNRGNPTSGQSSLMPSSRLASYASTAGTNQMGNTLMNNSVLADFSLQNSSLGSYQQSLPNDQLAAPGPGSQNFSMDDFPALRSSSLNNNHAKAEAWDYHGVREASQTNDSHIPNQGPQGNNESSQYPGDLRKLSGGVSTVESSNKNDMSNAGVWNDRKVNGKRGSTSDPYGLLGLLGVIRMTDPDRSMLALGSDLTTLGLDLNTSDSIYATFISPWSDTQTPPGLNVEPGYFLPQCYRNVQATPPARQRMRTFSDEILFYVFYCMPKDIAQEAAAQELYARNWRYHKQLGLWLTKEPSEDGRPVPFRRTSANALEQGVFIFFDPTTWQKVKREWTLSWNAIEDRFEQQGASMSQPSAGMRDSPAGLSSGFA
ncbi:hypothetical protein EC973_003673 [Apophysomyces ossiformis]|uniref:NOT2/NOT3/NOT5 C-terminal domain-containing protein n=1 Tax=Apophysomyces ossiformis TaxID=679940 RepID=A0A8H7BGY1_9FUNG|nr:hypothetical protein EC973_003673 [Apophysomyces ossiformis]